MTSIKRPNVWDRKNAEIADLKAQLQALRDRPMKEAFWECVGKNVAFLMSQRQKSEWPPICQTAFNHECQRTPTTGNLILMDLETRNGK